LHDDFTVCADVFYNYYVKRYENVLRAKKHNVLPIIAVIVPLLLILSIQMRLFVILSIDITVNIIYNLINIVCKNVRRH